jgi:transposase
MADLQTIIGTDKNNPYFTLLRNVEKKELLVYYGAGLMEIIPDEKEHPQLKLLIARLFNANVNKRKLTKHFGYSFQTMQRWSEALKSGDPVRLVHSLEGQGAPRKLTKEIEGYVSHRFKTIYATQKHTYSQLVRQELLEVFNLEISAETLRPLFHKLKEAYDQKNATPQKKTTL